MRRFLLTLLLALLLVPTAQAATFRDSVGVNIHTSYDGTPYTYKDVKALLADVGITHIRDYYVPKRPDQWKRLSALNARIDLGCGREWAIYMASCAAGAQANVTGLEALEGINEPDLGGISPLITRAAQTELYAARGTVPILAPSPSGRTDKDAYTATSDIANGHPYPGGRWETTEHSAGELERAVSQSHGHPAMATEWGINGCEKCSWVPEGNEPITDPVRRADVIVAGLLENQKVGWARTYIYELFDLWSSEAYEARWGIVDNDGTLKPAATYLKWWLAHLGDATPAADPWVSVQGADVRSSVWQIDADHQAVALWRTADVEGAPVVDVAATNGGTFDMAGMSASAGQHKSAGAVSAASFGVPMEPQLVVITKR